LSAVGVKGISSVAVKCVDIGKNTNGEGTLLVQEITDTEKRKLREQTGLDTLVVLAVNDGYWVVNTQL
jgi:hypothetical protein